jgi:UDP-glucose 4-epimerase
MRTFVAGGAGFLGSHAVERLLGTPAVEHVTVFDNFSSGRRDYLPQEDGRFSVVRGDISDLPSLCTAMQGHNVVFHFASNPDISQAICNPTLDFWQGTVLTQNVVEAMRCTGTRQILYASGSGVYGDFGDELLSEDSGPMLPVSTYGASKLAGEAILCAYCHMFGLQAWVFRFGNVVGPRQTHGVLFDFIRSLRANPNSLSIKGDGEQSKPYIHVEDALDAVWLAWRSGKDRFNSFNVATDDTTTVSEIAALAADALGLNKVRFEYAGGARGWPGDVPVVRLDCTKIKALGWCAQRNSRQALEHAARALGKELSSASPCPESA